jgi:5-formyltetrahydrofolate cyclo-ligase
MSDPVFEQKRKLRDEARERRRRAAAAAGTQAGERLAENYFEAAAGFANRSQTAPVSGYWPMAEEMDVRPLMRRLHAGGHVIGLPVVVAKGMPLVFRRWQPGAALATAAFGLRQPAADALQVVPEILLVPLLAFDPFGYRLGWGGGFYDRTLAALRKARAVIAVGVAYSAQRVERLPRTERDQPLDWVVTDEWFMEFRP